MQGIYKNILEAINRGEKLLAVLLDPDKLNIEELPSLFEKLHQSIVTHIFVGGSTDPLNKTRSIVHTIKNLTKLPIILFPGDYSQITEEADALLFLSLISGQNSEYLIGQQVKAASGLKDQSLEVIPTGYILIDGGVKTAVQKVSNTEPLSQKNEELIVNTAIAGQYLGKQFIYLEAGSGAVKSVNIEIIKAVKKVIEIPLIVGGGIRTKTKIKNIFDAGADIIVIGTAFEKDNNFFNDLKK